MQNVEIFDIADAPDNIIDQAERIAAASGHITRNAPITIMLLREMRIRARKERRAGDNRYRIWLLSLDGKLAGAASISPIPRSRGQSRFGLYICPVHRNKGLADILFKLSQEYPKVIIENVEEAEYFSRHLKLHRVCQQDGRHAFMR